MRNKHHIEHLIRHWHLTVAFFCILCFKISAQDLNIRWLQVSNEFPTTAVDDIEQDEAGNIIFANHLGVFSFDGLHYTNLTKEDGLTNSSSGGLYKDPYGRIWVTAYSGKVSIIENSKIKSFQLFNDSEYCDGSSLRIFCLSENLIVIDKWNSGVQLYYRNQNNSWKLVHKRTFNPELRLPIPLSGNRTDQVAWFSQKDPSNHNSYTLEVGSTEKTFTINPNQYSISRSLVNETVFLSVGNWLFRIQNGTLTYKAFSQTLGSVYAGNNGSIWLTFLSGSVQQLSESSLKALGEPILGTIHFRDLLQDREGNLWLNAGKGKTGMIPFSPYKKWQVGNSIETSLNTIFSLNDTLFLGHINGDVGFLIPGKMDKEIVFYRMEQDSKLRPSNIRGFTVFKGSIYFFSQFNGLFRIDRKSRKVDYVVKDIGISKVYNAGDVLYLATTKGLIKYDGKTQKLVLKKTFVTVVTITSGGKLLLGTLDGLYEYENGTARRVKWSVPTDERITSFARSEATIIIGTYGLGLIVKKGNSYSTIRHKDGLPSDFINSLMYDSKGRLIVTTGNGIAMITFDSKSRQGYLIQQIAGNECMDHDTYNATELNNKLFFSSFNGLLKVSNIHESKRGNPIVLKQITLNGDVLKDSILSFSYNQNNQLVFTYRQNNFTSNKNTIYFYRLNQDQEWIRTTNESILLKGMSPGNHLFEIYAYNPTNGYRSNIIRQKINVIPQFYQQIWVQVLFFLSVFVVSFLIIRKVIRNREIIRKKELEYQLELTKLEARALRSQMNPHFIFNSLNSIQSFILKNDRDSAYKYLGKFSELIREILENSRNEKISIADEIHMLTNYLELERMRSDNSFNFEIVVDVRIHEHTIQIPIMLLQPIAENAVVHGAIPLEGKTGMISIVFCLVNESTIEIVVRDNGIGRKASQELNERKQRYHRSMGMEISEERANKQLMNDHAYSFEMKDLHAEDGAAAGTEVIIRINLQHD